MLCEKPVPARSLDEADPISGKISHESPLGLALLGKKVGEQIEVDAPVGKLIYKILDILL